MTYSDPFPILIPWLAKYAIPPLVLLGMAGATVLAVVWYCIAQGTKDTPNTGRKPEPLPWKSHWWELPVALVVAVFLLAVIDLSIPRKAIETTCQGQRIAMQGSQAEPGEILVQWPILVALPDGRQAMQNIPFWVKTK